MIKVTRYPCQLQVAALVGVNGMDSSEAMSASGLLARKRGTALPP
jgi:hypothetical protein